MARNQNQSETVVHTFQVGNTTNVVRHIVDSKGRNFVDVRQFFLPADGDGETWVPTRYGVRFPKADWDAVSAFKLPKDPVDTKTVTVKYDEGIKLPAKPAKAQKSA